MFLKKLNKGSVAALVLVPFFLIGGTRAASAMSVDVTGLSYRDYKSGVANRSIVYDFTDRTVAGNAIQIPEGSLTRESGETGTTYFWGDASAVMPGIPAVTVVSDGALKKATVSPATPGSEGVAALYATPLAMLPPASGTVSWDYTIDLWNFNVDLSAQKAYRFNASLGRPTEDYNEAGVSVIWVKGFYNGLSYPQDTLILQAHVRSSGVHAWDSAPIVRTGLTPATTSVALQLQVTDGNHFAASVSINGGPVEPLGAGYTLPAAGQFLRFPDLYPVLVLEEESASTEPQAIVQTSHFQTGNTYNAAFFVMDPLHKASAVRVTGVGNAYDHSLTWDEMNKSWYSTVNYEMGVVPATPYPSFTFAFTPQSGGPAIASATKSVTGYVTAFASNLQPTGEVSANPVFSWMGIAGANNYGIELSDASTGNRVWSRYGIPETDPVTGSPKTYTYDGPALETGKSYTYLIRSQVEQGDSMNASLSANASFTYTGASTAIAFNGSVKEATGYPGTPVSLANVQVVGTPALSSTTDSNGNFRIDGIPPSTHFSLMITKEGGYYLPTYSAFFNWNADITALLPYAMYSPADYGAYNSSPGTDGLIVGRVTQLNNPTAYLSGAVVTAVQWDPTTQQPTGTTYTVHYDFAGATSTNSTGFFFVQVPAGVFGPGIPTVVKVSVQPLAGYTFTYTDAWLPVYINGVSQESFFAMPAGATISFSGVVRKYADDTPYSGALVEQVGIPSVNTTSGADGTFTLTGLPPGTEFSVKITGDGSYVPTYTRVIRDTVDVTAARNYNLFTPSDLTAWGVTSGGAIRGRVINGDSTDAGYVSGAVVSYSSQLGRTDYVVKYEDQFNVLSTGAGTTANGKYYILGVAEGDTVTVTATHPDYTFPLLNDANARKFNTHANAVSEAIIKGTRVAGRVAIGGYIKDGSGAAIKGATIEQVGQTVPLNATVSNGDGAFYMTVPSGATFHLKFSRPQSTTPPAPTYTAEMNFTANALSLGDYNLFQTSKLGTGTGNWNVTSGKGIIRARVRDNQGNNLGGATVSYVSSGGFTYTVCYDDACTITNANGGSTPTTGDIGRYLIKNVEPGDTVTVTAVKEGYAFNSRVFHTYGNSLHQGGPAGTPQDESTIRSRFDALLTEYNKGASGNIDTVMAYFSDNFLDNGEDKAARRADMLAGMTAGETRTYSGVTVTLGGDGLTAVMVITWSNGETDKMYWAKEGGVWLIKGNQARHDVGVQSQHWADGYRASIYVQDTPTTQTLTSVTVTGPGITAVLNLTYDAGGYWTDKTGSAFLGPTPPAGPQTYTITVMEAGIPYEYTRTITGYVIERPAIQSPTASYGTPIAFVWRGVPGASRYAVELSDASWNRLWEKRRIPQNQWAVVYDGQALTPGATYNYNIVAEVNAGDERNQSFGQGTFTYSASGQSVIAYSGYIKDTNGAPVSGAMIEHANAFNTGSTASDAGGLFTLGNALARTPFHFRMYGAGYLSTYTAYMGSNVNIDDTAGNYSLFIPSEFTTMGGASGKGVIWGRVRDAGQNRLAGAIVTAWSALGKNYEIRYYDELVENYRTTGGTYASGRFAVANVEPDDRVVVNAQLGGFAFNNPRVFQTHADAVSQGSVFAAGSCSYTIAPTAAGPGAMETNLTINVTTAPGCTWGAVSNVPSWLIVGSLSTDNGSGTVGITVAGNDTGANRTGTVMIAGQTLTVTQKALSLDATVLNLETAAAGTGSVNVTVPAGVSWTAASNNDWIIITAGAGGTGSGAVSFNVAANPLSTPRTGTLTIGGQTFTVNQAGTGTVPAWVGTWGVQQLIHFDPGYDQVDGIGSVPWYAEVSRATLNLDGTGTMTMTKNDHNGQLINQTLNFNYTITPNADGSLNWSGNVGEGTEQQPFSLRLVIADDGQMGIVDGTAAMGQQKLMVLFRIDPSKSYSAADVNGEYYNVGFERNMTNVQDPPDNGNGAFMAISSIHTFKGNGLYDYYGKANSVKSDGSSLVWTDAGKTNQTYAISADGTFTAGGTAFKGWFTGNGLVGGGGGDFSGSVANPVNNQTNNFFMKKGDRPYLQSDLAGKWALVTFGQGSPTSYNTYAAQIGTLTCDAAGACSFKLRDRRSDGTSHVDTGNVTLTVAGDGSFGASMAPGAPAYAGAVGNNGNTIMFNTGFNPDEIWHREIFIGIRANSIGDLAASGILLGDLDGIGGVNLADAIIAMKVLAGLNVSGTLRSGYAASGTDVNGDNKVGLQELLYILQVLANKR